LNAAELADLLRERLPETVVARGEVIAVVEPTELVTTLEELRGEDTLAFDFLSSLTATDRPGRSPRYWVVYELYSMRHAHRLRVKVGIEEDAARVPSVAGVFPTADWHEREVFDLYGIVFDGHPNLRRILLPEGWEGYPLRKTEELGGVNTRYRGAFIPPVDRRTT
jgi:NADH-quinone oxidoreductase subunit C